MLKDPNHVEMSPLEQVVKAFFHQQAAHREGVNLYRLVVHCTQTAAVTGHLKSLAEDWHELPQFDANGDLICLSTLPR